MDFANLFTSLSAVGDVRSDAQTASAPRNRRESSKRGKSTKRKPQGAWIGPFNKKQCFQAQMDNYKFSSFKNNNHYQQNTDTKEVTRYQSNKGDKTIYHQGQNYPARDVSKPQQPRKKMEGQSNQHQMRNGWKKNNQMRGGREDRKHYSYSLDAPAKFATLMTQGFKDQNGLIINGQLFCRHFIKGTCIKGDECQLKHMQACNDLIKEMCKFYIQGSCSKGESCPYMHKSFPCKFFHRKGKCSQGPNCRFSHEPLNDFTTQLLDKALKRESEFNELAKKAEQESSGQQVTTDESKDTPANQPPDVLIQPVRPNFYNSEETNAPQKADADDVKEAVPPQPPGHSPLSAESDNQEPVCYSVEAVLGRPLFKPFPSFFTTPQSQESSSLSVEKCSPDSANQSEAPYSVDAVLRSCKSVESSTFRRAAQPASYNPKSHFADITDSLLSPDPQNKKVLCSASRRSEEAKGKLFNSLPSHKACPDLTLKSSDLKKEGEIHDVKLEVLRSPAVLSEKSFSITPERCDWKSLTCSNHPTQLKSRVSGLTSNPKASVKTPPPPPPPPPPGFSEFKRKAAVSAAHVLCSARTPDPVDLKQLPEIQQHSTGTESDLRLCTQRQSFNESPAADCSSKMENSCNEPPERLFQSLFASPITSLKATPHSVTTPVSCSTRQSEHSKPVRTAVEPCKPSTRSFLNLFASPLSAAPVSQPHCTSTTSCSQDSHKPYTSKLSDSNQTASKSDTSLRCQKKSHAKQTRHWSSPPSKLPTNIKNENNSVKQQVNPDCHLVSHSPSTFSSPPCVTHPDRFTAQQRPSLLSHKGSAAAAAPDSVLKTLFLHLSPYQQDGQQQDSLHKVKSKVEAQDSHKQSHEKTAVPSTERGSTLCSTAVTEPQLRNFGPHNPRIKAVTSPTQNHTPQRLKLITEELKWVNRNVGATSLKDIFKSFDTTVHQFGH